MKFLHTADLHLGRTFRERPLIDDQKSALRALIEQLGKDDYAALLIAGDVYDRSIPSPEAVGVLGWFLAEVRRRFPALTVVASSGNHDSPERLAYGGELFSALGIHLVCDPERSAAPIVVEKNGERCAVFALPFLFPGSLRRLSDGDDGAPLRSQRDLASEAAGRLEEGRRAAEAAGAETSVLVAHLFAVGGAESESERCFLGTAERVDISLFSSFGYVALGHLHRFQKAGKNAWYSGSPLAYAFDEAGAEKCFASVEIKPGEAPVVTPIAIEPPRRVSRLSGAFDSFMEANAHSDRRADYLEIVLTDPHLVENPLALLRQRYPHLLSVRQDAALSASFPDGAAAAGTRSIAARRDVADDFAEFAAELYGEVDPDKMELFRSMAKEAEHATA